MSPVRLLSKRKIAAVPNAPLGPVLWALVDFQLTPLTRNNLLMEKTARETRAVKGIN